MTIDRARFGSGAADKSLLRVPQRSVLADEVYEILKESLRSHQIAPGQRLNLDQLARELHVSNTPVRQALARLEADGLVTKEPYRGFRATQLLDSHTIAELYDYRLLIEPACAARAARRGDAVTLSELQSLCEPGEIRRLIADADEHEAIGLRDVDFHLAISTSAGNSVVTDNLAAALTRMQLYTVYDRQGAGEEAWGEHRQVLAAIKDGDPEGAASAMRTHLLNGLERLRSVVR